MEDVISPHGRSFACVLGARHVRHARARRSARCILARSLTSKPDIPVVFVEFAFVCVLVFIVSFSFSLTHSLTHSALAMCAFLQKREKKGKARSTRDELDLSTRQDSTIEVNNICKAADANAAVDWFRKQDCEQKLNYLSQTKPNQTKACKHLQTLANT